MLLSRGREGCRPGWPMGARWSGQHRPSAPAHRDLALRGKEEAKKFLLRARRASVRGRCSHCNSATAGRGFRFPCRCPGARKSSAVWTEKKGAYLRAREGGARTRPRARASTPGWKVGAGPRVPAACGDPGRARGCGTTMGAPRLRALAAALGLLLCEVLGHAGPAEGGGLEALGPPSGVGAEPQCPAPCRCLGDLLDCSRQRLAHVPEPLPTWIARL